MSKDDMSRRLAEILREPDPAKFDQKVDDLVGEIMEEYPDGPDFYTVKEQVMDSVSKMFEILPEED